MTEANDHRPVRPRLSAAATGPQPGAGAPTQPRPRPEARPRPDPNPMRLMAGLVGLASLSAIATGLLPSIVAPASAGTATGATTVAADPTLAPVRHVTRYVQLKPGQTAPPQASIVAAPKPTPRVVVVTTTRQSGKP